MRAARSTLRADRKPAICRARLSGLSAYRTASSAMRTLLDSERRRKHARNRERITDLIVLAGRARTGVPGPAHDAEHVLRALHEHARVDLDRDRSGFCDHLVR